MARKPKTATAASMPILPPLPPPTAEQIAKDRWILEELKSLNATLLQRNLDTAVLLAQQAARGGGPLIDHFAELGRRYGRTLNEPATPKLRLVD